MQNDLVSEAQKNIEMGRKILLCAWRARKTYPWRQLSRNSKLMDRNWEWLELTTEHFVC